MGNKRRGLIRLNLVCCFIVLIFGFMSILVSCNDDGDSGSEEGNNEEAYNCSENDIVGVWIIDVDDDIEGTEGAAYIEFGLNGEVLGFQAFGDLSGLNTYTLNDDCTFDGEITVSDADLLFEGNIEMEENDSGFGSITFSAELDSDKLIPGDMEKVASISALEGDWEGTYTESGPYGDNNETVSFSISSFGSFNAFSGLGNDANRGKFYATPTGMAVGYIELISPNENRYKRMLFVGELDSSSTIGGTVYLDSNEDFITTFSVTKVTP